MSLKIIVQNRERYSKQLGHWVVSASPDIAAIHLPNGSPLPNLKPLIKASGIIVKVGDNYLCSLSTLNDIKDSANPHFDIIQNGSISVSTNKVPIGKTIRIIELDLSKLQSIIDARNTLNKNAAVLDVLYTIETDTIDGIPAGLIEQINYTLDMQSERPKDEYSIVDLYRMVDYMNNDSAAHYKITPLLVQTQQADTIFDPAKLRTYLIEVSEKLKKLEMDFNMLQDIFYTAKLPEDFLFEFTEISQATPDTDTNINHTVRRYNRSMGTFEDNILSKINQLAPTSGSGSI